MREDDVKGNAGETPGKKAGRDSGEERRNGNRGTKGRREREPTEITGQERERK